MDEIMRCFYCGLRIWPERRWEAWTLLLNQKPAHVKCCPRTLRMEEEAAR